ncbi:hypothetical protein BUALT_Bualt02G0142200 [Buddleja alternifolia]|uniref:Transposase, Ptta/En/Spm, plant n=1 Tax=Buddleja alternifolia TaxID=168488 RepID=A0AAV6YAU0_9LAMI|nr:hypothetical protein BUALT_Bualt02G0142200 [Buddleja alternifolia]
MGGPGRRVDLHHSSLRTSSVDLHSHESRISRTIENFDVDEEIVVNSTSISSGKKKRGRTRNVALPRRKNAYEKLTVDIPEEVNRIVGVNSQYAITESGCLARRFAPLKVTKWGRIEEDKKLDLLRDFRGSFNFGESVRCNGVILSQMNTQYRNFRHKLYKKYFLRGITPAHVDPNDWEYLCTYFASEEYQRISRRNTENWAAQDARHIVGTKSFARICRDREEKKWDVVGPIELYKLTRYKCDEGAEKGYWISDIAKENHRKMVECQKEIEEAGENPVDEEKICCEVLGFKSGYVRGRGAGPKPSTSRNYREELDEAKRNARIAQEKVLVFSEQLENQKTIIEDLKEGLAATQRAMVESQKSTTEMMLFFQQLRQTSHLPAASPRFKFHVPPNLSQQNIQTSMHGFAPTNIQNSNRELDSFARELELRQLFQEVSRSYTGPDLFRAQGSR